MTKKPATPTVVNPSSRTNPLAPPTGLGEAGRKLWHAIHADYVVEDSAGLEMLTQICAAADRVAEYDEEIGRDGVTIRVKGTVREHPLLKIRLGTASFILRSLHRLNLDVVAPRTTIGRPAGPYRSE